MTTPNKKPQRFLGIPGFARRVSLSPGTIASYARKGLLPEPDAITDDGEGGNQTRGWTPATIDYWATHRLGQGRRTDLRRPRTPKRHQGTHDDRRPLRNAHSVPERPSSPKGHPRSRGVNKSSGIGRNVDIGSSPLTRGQPR